MGGRKIGAERIWLAFLAAALALASAVPAQARWLRAESARFVIYSDGAERQLRDYAMKLEDFDGVLRLFHGLPADAPPPRKLDIYLASGRGQILELFPKAPQNLAGFYAAQTEDIFAVASRESFSDLGRDEVIFHEYTHHFTQQYFPYGYPSWLMEGWAEYFAPTEILTDRINVGKYSRNRAYTLVAGSWLPLSELLRKRAFEVSASQRSAFYAEAWLLVHYMLNDPGRKRQLDAYVKAVGAGADPVRAMETATGANLKALDGQLRAYETKPIAYNRLTRKDHVDAEVKITALPPSADALLLVGQRLKSGRVEKGDEAELLKTVRAAAAKFPGDRLAETVLARAEIDFGDRAAGEAILQRRLAGDGDDVELLTMLAASRLAAGQKDPGRRVALFAEARSLLGRAFKVDPDRYQTLYAYAVARSADPGYPSDNTLDVLRTAHRLAPQVDAISFRTAAALMRRKQFEEATILLTVLANDPHGGDLADRSRKMLVEAAAKRPPTDAATAAASGDAPG
ncbi:MAG: DUF1570 domain-containing protein [Caulobacteraceae bacterium]|nr:DUF1570 domain-containing protein [Caulobacteraceae bacterium]